MSHDGGLKWLVESVRERLILVLLRVKEIVFFFCFCCLFVCLVFFFTINRVSDRLPVGLLVSCRRLIKNII